MRARGFTLIEAIVALAILGLSLGTLLPVLSGQLRTAGLARDHRLALLFAESKLTELTQPVNLVAGLGEGALPGGFRWRAEIAPVEGDYRLRPFRVAVEVRPPGAGAAVRLATIALASR